MHTAVVLSDFCQGHIDHSLRTPKPHVRFGESSHEKSETVVRKPWNRCHSSVFSKLSINIAQQSLSPCCEVDWKNAGFIRSKANQPEKYSKFTGSSVSYLVGVANINFFWSVYPLHNYLCMLPVTPSCSPPSPFDSECTAACTLRKRVSKRSWPNSKPNSQKKK